MAIERLTRSGARDGAAFAAYVLLTLAWFWNLLPVIGRAFPHDLGDPAFNAWILEWNSRVVPFTGAWWNAPSFYPAAGATAFTELLVGANLFASPVLWLTHNPVLAYNVVFLLSFALSGFAGYLLALELSGDRRAAFVAGVAFGFAPYRVAQVPHLQVLLSFWMPIALFALHRYLRQRRVRWLVLFAGAWLLQALSNGYYLLFFTVFLGAWAAWFMSRREERRALPPAALAWLVAALPLIPVLLRYREVQNTFGMVRHFQEILFFSGDLTSFVTASPDLGLWGWLRHFAKPEGELFPGVTILLLVALGLIASWRRRVAFSVPVRPEPSLPGLPRFRGLARLPGLARFPSLARLPALRLSHVRVAFGCAALVTGLVVLGYFVFGSWKLSLGGTTVLSARRFDKSFGAFFVCAALWAVMHPRFVDAVRRRSAFAFYVLAAGVIAVTSLGPEPRAMGERFFSRAPYALLLELPGFTSLRVPTRFWMLGVLCLSAAGALAFNRLFGARETGSANATAGSPTRPERPLAPSTFPSAPGQASASSVAWLPYPPAVVGMVVFSLAIAAEGWPVGMQVLAPAPRLACRDDNVPAPTAFLQLPLGSPLGDIAALGRAQARGVPSINGYSGYVPPHYLPLQFALENYDAELLTEFSRLGPLEVAVETSLDFRGRWARLIAEQRGAVELAGCGEGVRVFRLPAASSASGVPPASLPGGAPPGRPLRIVNLKTDIVPQNLGRMVDDNVATSWSVPQNLDHWVLVDLGAAQPLAEVSLLLGPAPLDFPRSLRIEHSLDAQSWKTAFEGPTHGVAMWGAAGQPTRIPLRFPMGSITARYLRLTQYGRQPLYAWSVAELIVTGR